MTYKDIKINVSATLTAGAKCQVLGTIYTVPASQSLLLKEIQMQCFSGASVSYTIYVLKSGATDLTTAASNTTLISRMVAESKTVYELCAAQSGAAVNGIVFSRNILLSAGDKINVWATWGAVTPGLTYCEISASGDLT